MPDKKRKRKHGDTRVSLAPLSSEQAIATIAQAPRREDSQAEESGRTKGRAHVSAPPKKRTAPRRKSSGG